MIKFIFSAVFLLVVQAYPLDTEVPSPVSQLSLVTGAPDLEKRLNDWGGAFCTLCWPDENGNYEGGCCDPVMQSICTADQVRACINFISTCSEGYQGPACCEDWIITGFCGNSVAFTTQCHGCADTSSTLLSFTSSTSAWTSDSTTSTSTSTTTSSTSSSSSTVTSTTSTSMSSTSSSTVSTTTSTTSSETSSTTTPTTSETATSITTPTTPERSSTTTPTTSETASSTVTATTTSNTTESITTSVTDLESSSTSVPSVASSDVISSDSTPSAVVPSGAIPSDSAVVPSANGSAGPNDKSTTFITRPNSTITVDETIFTTYCDEPTTFTWGGETFTVTRPTTLTITSCPDEGCEKEDVTTTLETTIFTTYCPEPTTFTWGETTYTVTEATTLTITSCPESEAPQYTTLTGADVTTVTIPKSSHGVNTTQPEITIPTATVSTEAPPVVNAAGRIGESAVLGALALGFAFVA